MEYSNIFLESEWKQRLGWLEDYDPESHATSLNQKRVLVVEDNIETQFILTRSIKQIDPEIDVTIATTKEEALGELWRFRRSKNMEYTLVIADINLPNQTSGLDLRRNWLHHEPRTPFIMISSITPLQFDRSFPPYESCPLYLQKPFRPKDFRQLVSEVLIEVREK